MLSAYRVTFLLTLFSLLAPWSVTSALQDDNWDSSFAPPPGLNGEAVCSLIVGRDLYVGGRFTKAGDIEASGIARWDGQQWHAVGLGVEGEVYALTLHQNELCVGGRFVTRGAVPATNIAKWTGTEWEDLKGGMPLQSSEPFGEYQAVYALLSHGGDLYVGGIFVEVGGVHVANLARWDGRGWHGIGGGVGFPSPLPNRDLAGGYVKALAFYGRFLYVGGNFNTAGRLACNNIACWNGAKWGNLSGGVTGGDRNLNETGSVEAFAVHKGELYLGGNFSTAGRVSARNIAKCSGGFLQPVARAVSGLGRRGDRIEALVSNGPFLIAGGRFTMEGGRSIGSIARLNGIFWEPLGAGIQGTVHTLSIAGPVVYAGGFFGAAGKRPAGSVAQWKNAKWSSLGSVPSGNNSFMGIPQSMDFDGQAVIICGYLASVGTEAASAVVSLAHNKWMPLGINLPERVWQVAAVSNRVYAAGLFEMPEIRATNLVCWDGRRWSAVGEDTGSLANSPTYIDRMISNGENLFVNGSRPGESGARFYVWNQREWVKAGDDVTGSAWSMVSDGGKVYVSGYLNISGSLSTSSLAVWDGVKWELVDAAPFREGFIGPLALGNGVLYASGVSQNGSAIAAWDGTSWSVLATNNAHVIDMVAQGTSLYVCGSFSEFEGQPANNIVQWNGFGWRALGSGLDGPATLLATDGQSIFVGGLFSTAGGKRSYNFGVWHPPSVESFSRPGGR